MAKRFYGTPTHKAGLDSATVFSGRVINVNLVNFTVDVISLYDRYYMNDIQVISPYLHYNNGEGIYVMPDVGAMCMITMPSDTSPPFVSGFLAPMEVVGGTGKPEENPDQAITTNLFGAQSANQSAITGTDAPDGTRSRGGTVPFPNTDARFDAGRPAVKSGDIWVRGRDGNFLVLHRGGVLQIGSTELAQRIFIPISNKVLDISGTYEHMNTGGEVLWGVQEGPSIANPACQMVETYRLFANDEFCDLKVAWSKVFNPVGEPDGDAGGNDDIQNLDLGVSQPIVCEIVLAKNGFKAGSADVASSGVRNETKLRFFFDRTGGVFLRAEGAANFFFKKELRIRTNDNASLRSKKQLVLEGEEGIQLLSGKLIEIKGDVVRLGAGTTPVARQGDTVSITIPTASVTGTVGGQAFTGVMTIPTPLFGNIVTGNVNLLG